MRNRSLRGQLAAGFLLAAWLVFSVVPGGSTAQAASFVVDTVADAVDATPGDAQCVAVGGGCTLRAAVMEANALVGPDDISLPAGTFTLDVGEDCEAASIGGDLDILDDLTLRGAGIGVSIIQGDGGDDRVLEVHGADTDVTVGDLTLTGGDAFCGLEGGGAIRNAGITVLERTEVVGNSGFYLGALVNLAGAELYLRDSTVHHNAVQGLGDEICSRGGGLVNLGLASLERSSVDENEACEGGGISNGGSLFLAESQVTGNDARGGDGGGIFNGGSLRIEKSELSGNVAEPSDVCPRPGSGLPCLWVGGSGGAIATGAGNGFWIEDTRIENNVADRFGGGILLGGGLTIVRSTIGNNRADAVISGEVAAGGGVHLGPGAQLALNHSTLHHNESAGAGGGVAASGAGVVALNSTFSANSAASDGGAIHADDSALSLDHVTLAQNLAAGTGSAVHHDASDPVWTNSLVVGSCAGSGTAISKGGNVESPGDGCGLTGPDDQVNVVDARIGPLEDNGGSTLTHGLLAKSPARDAAPADAACALIDQRGESRPKGPRCDSGAVEEPFLGCGAVGGGGGGAIGGLWLAIALAVRARRRDRHGRQGPGEL